MKKIEGFFAVGLQEWRDVCALGLNPAVAFLVLACGTDGSNQKTNWSAQSVEKYGGIHSKRAIQAIATLIAAGIVKHNGNDLRPQYSLRSSDEIIWLPNSLVKGTGDQQPREQKTPVKEIRQLQDVILLWLYVELYYSQNLAADGGLERSVFCLNFEKIRPGTYGEFVFLEFRRAEHHATWKTEVPLFHEPDVIEGGVEEGKGSADAFSLKIDTLRRLGLLEMSVCLFEWLYSD